MTTVDNYSFSNRARLQLRLLLFFSQHEPERARVDSIVNRTVDLALTEASIFSRACAKYFVPEADEAAEAEELGLLPPPEGCDMSPDFAAAEVAIKVSERLERLKAVNPVRNFSAKGKADLRDTLVAMFDAAEVELPATEEMELLLNSNVSEDALLSRVAAVLGLEELGEGEEQKQEEEPSCPPPGAAAAASTQQEDQHAVPVCRYFGANKNRLRMRVSNFYERHHPDALENGKVEHVLEMQHTEQEIFATLRKRYPASGGDGDGEEDQDVLPAAECPGSAGGPVSLYSARDQARFLKRLGMFYDTYHPDGANMIPAVLGMQNAEESIMRRLVIKYAVAAGDSVEDAVAREEQAAAAFLPEKWTSGFQQPPPPPRLSPSHVADYDEGSKQRLRVRLSSFYQRHSTDPSSGIGKIEAVANMVETEESIFATLCQRYGCSESDEQGEAAFLQVLPRGRQPQRRVPPGETPVAEYPAAEKQRLRLRVKQFYDRHASTVTPEEVAAKVLGVADMIVTEKDVFVKLRAKYGVTEEEEIREAKAAWLFPVFSV